MSGETYYSWLASSYSPVIQFRQHRLEGDGICFQLDGGKAQQRGFVTVGDLSSAAERDPDLRMRAMSYQKAFTEGMFRGMTDALNESAGPADGESRLANDPDAPDHLTKYSQEWQAWRNGYGYGERLSRPR